MIVITIRYGYIFSKKKKLFKERLIYVKIYNIKRKKEKTVLTKKDALKLEHFFGIRTVLRK